ncbi:ATP-binding protein [Chitinophaga alhagiae]|uniref:ATP-binding protein n=1 Tax=Chitinophaga alhagiae TaxID=2203219 RepID=UPI000E5B7169|nr:ATP-binding protein [Chitinophaga alhagiae]
MAANSFHIPLQYLRNYVAGRMDLHFGKASSVTVDTDAYWHDGSPFAVWMEEHKPGPEEYVCLLLALAPHLQPSFFEDILREYIPEGGNFIDFGGAKSQYHRGVLPTGETMLFILAGNDVNKRVELQDLLLHSSVFFKQGILSLETVPYGEPRMSGRLLLAEETLEFWLTGRISHPRFSSEFAAEHISTAREWEDLVLNDHTLSQIREIEEWIRHHHTLLHEWQFGSRMKHGYCALFHGPPGTGKTLAATLLGKYTGLDVFRIDLSKVVSKYIGETEKNLARIFDRAERKKWVLFFDEADALFGKRTEIRDAHDKYANQEVGYLLQRVENYNGLIILASNFKANMDEAFLRRMQNVVYFPIPAEKERYILWERSFPQRVRFASDVSLHHISKEHELTGSNINNIAYFCCLKLISNQKEEITSPELLYAIRRELLKEGKG